MGRPSKLTEPMRVEIGRRIAAGESTRALAREYRIAESTLRGNFSAQAPAIRNVATALANAEVDLLRLPIAAQQSARSLADQLKSIQLGYGETADRATKTALKMAKLAGRIADEIPEDSVGPDALASAAVVGELSRVVNHALTPASNLIAANKGTTTNDKTLEDLLEEANQQRRG